MLNRFNMLEIMIKYQKAIILIKLETKKEKFRVFQEKQDLECLNYIKIEYYLQYFVILVFFKADFRVFMLIFFNILYFC